MKKLILSLFLVSLISILFCSIVYGAEVFEKGRQVGVSTLPDNAVNLFLFNGQPVSMIIEKTGVQNIRINLYIAEHYQPDIIISFGFGEIKDVDLDGDGTSDIRINFQGMEGKMAGIVITIITSKGVFTDCIEKSCPDWGNCVNGQRTRTCTQIDKCTGTTDQTGESGACPGAECDSDGGYDIYKKGTTKGYYPNSIKTDYCINSETLVEYTCEVDVNSVITITPNQVTCPSSYICSDGACLEAPEFILPIPDQVLYKNTGLLYALDLNQHFKGKDLTFVVTYSKNVDVFVAEDGLVSFRLAQNWCGTDSVVFSAVDLIGSRAQSNEVLLTVRCEEYPDTSLQNPSPYCGDWVCDSNEGCSCSDCEGKKNGCPSDAVCWKGKCAMCIDTDEGNKIHEKGTIKVVEVENMAKPIHEDYCIDSFTLVEYVCEVGSGGIFPTRYEIKCSIGYECKDGACIPCFGKCPELISDTKTPAITECEGCILQDTCVPFGYRKNGLYCDINKEFVSQKGEKAPCNNDFECLSNTCSNGICISLEKEIRESISILKKIWCKIQNLFSEQDYRTCLNY